MRTAWIGGSSLTRSPSLKRPARWAMTSRFCVVVSASRCWAQRVVGLAAHPVAHAAAHPPRTSVAASTTTGSGDLGFSTDPVNVSVRLARTRPQIAQRPKSPKSTDETCSDASAVSVSLIGTPATRSAANTTMSSPAITVCEAKKGLVLDSFMGTSVFVFRPILRADVSGFHATRGSSRFNPRPCCFSSELRRL